MDESGEFTCSQLLNQGIPYDPYVKASGFKG